ncbi:hypothetical protein [Arenibacterium halophilum]|uniref:SnoaL-like domain-containing protein n=1 Tax=Arenibacterium halophilum TaxID=2583821 RepID=A0ABY2X8W6_9RHOB|nr:hypothetical protein [Arenibacterium halophilum]TMV11926.1 hypothetical protein FGK64_16880 [Arenibacterium halophilum]
MERSVQIFFDLHAVNLSFGNSTGLVKDYALPLTMFFDSSEAVILDETDLPNMLGIYCRGLSENFETPLIAEVSHVKFLDTSSCTAVVDWFSVSLNRKISLVNYYLSRLDGDWKISMASFKRLTPKQFLACCQNAPALSSGRYTV